MNRTGNEFLASACFPGDQYGGVASGDSRHTAEHWLQRGRRPDNLLEHGGPVQLVAKHQVLLIELILQGTKLRFCSLPVVAVGEQDVPADDLPVHAAERKAACLKPAVRAVK